MTELHGDTLARTKRLAAMIHAKRVKEARQAQANPRGGLLEFIRYFWHVLEPVDPFIEGWPLECLCAHLEAITRGDTVEIGGVEKRLNRLLANVPPGFMKLCADSTPILTPDGYRTHGDLKPGDRVFGPDGKPTKVLRISPKALADYEVSFSTHETIKCNGDHLWHVYDRWARKHKTIDTRELYEAATEPDRNRFFIPDTRCLEFPERELPLHPYFLGCWLGDGTSNKPAISHSVNDTEHIAKLAGLGYHVTAQYAQKDTRHSNFCYQGVIETLRDMELYKNKHIPEEYLTASESQRLELLAGLIDTDGTVDRERGRCLFYTCDPELAEGVQRLILSLGMRPYITLMDAPGYGEYTSDKTYHLVGFQPDRPIPTAIPRKQIQRLDFAKRKRAIVSVKKSSAPEMGHCITVEREDGLYVVGRTNLVTHNSLTVNCFWPAWEWGPIEMPHLRYVAFSYAAERTEQDNSKFRDLICSNAYRELWGHVFTVIGDGKVRVTNDKTGFKFASSFGGVGTGERGHRVLLDDPHKVKGTQETDEARTAVTTWVREGMQNRLNDLGRDTIIVIMQRLHEEDSSGAIMKHLDDEYCHLIIPMEYEANRHFSHYTGWNHGQDPREYDGELAWPERYPAQTLNSYKRNDYLWSGQYQQNPVPRGGGLFKDEWWQVHEVQPKANGGYKFVPDVQPIFVLASLDTAYSEKEENDYSALTVWVVHDNHFTKQRNILLADAWAKQLPNLSGPKVEPLPGESPAVFRRRAMEKWGLAEWVVDTCNRRRVNRLIVENKNRAPDVIKEIKKLFADRDWGVQSIDIKGDKWGRAHAITDIFTDDMVFAPAEITEAGDVRWLEWADEAIKQISRFPRGGHDDILDSMTLAMKYLRDTGYAIRKDERTAIENARMSKRHGPRPAIYAV